MDYRKGNSGTRSAKMERVKAERAVLGVQFFINILSGEMKRLAFT